MIKFYFTTKCKTKQIKSGELSYSSHNLILLKITHIAIKWIEYRNLFFGWKEVYKHKRENSETINND